MELGKYDVIFKHYLEISVQEIDAYGIIYNHKFVMTEPSDLRVFSALLSTYWLNSSADLPLAHTSMTATASITTGNCLQSS